MTDREVKKLDRARLTALLREETARVERLAEENAGLRERIAERERSLAEAGELSEAAARMSGAEAAPALERVRDAGRAAADAMTADGEPEPEPERDGVPTPGQLERLVRRARYRSSYVWSLKSTVYALVTVAAIAVLVAVLLLPVLRIYGSSMNPTLYEGDYVISVKNAGMKTGDLCAFYYNNRILVKRVIAQPGQWVDLDGEGTVYVDNVRIDEPYLRDKALGECDVELPYQVPESRIFVMGDNRSVSVDSRSTTVGCVAEEQVVGKIVFRVWPLAGFGKLA